mmetsp:Transcript_57252/g.101533  ORF Transcript_57252/g.101533 Transcript_57252/m.101533 type:complete len:223 (+) Transcript_57252:55-723(+)|eukprot:CAMPEP_0197647876 /NCGR_PEP_ID=MMETSP1338-20131121/26756_1 /TAXON_ID=43686 ORGANISM="Pelagodinium beii, Strain RCC1491" /NCGR_SAMPLE_ID=MMETSP1338 /ASSEMBLY_ACC=CAM_ASM_000754 /LENGTH=222 /DNA_ID=CAMNT_0043221763 /DNA_START=50 /DNA_END=718 /DNA_ORIENTATION=-
MSKLVPAAIAAAALMLAVAGQVFLLPGARAPQVAHPRHVSGNSELPDSGSDSWGLAAAGLALGAHVGLAAVWRGKTARFAEAKAAPAAAKKYVETPGDQRLFEQVYLQYTSEYLKGPLYWHPHKNQGQLPDVPGEPLFMNGRLSSNVVGQFRSFTSTELAFLSAVAFGIGLYGNLQFLFYDPQFERVDAGGFFNVSYIVESLLLPTSFFLHIAAYIQKQAGK